jgi:hypothetical protein
MKINLILVSISLVCILSFLACDETPILPDESQTPIDELAERCGDVNKVACDFEFRKGKWLEIQDSLDATLVQADTIHFMEDSLIAWSFQGEPYIVLIGYFTRNNLYSQLFNGGPVNTRRGIVTEYFDDTKVFRIGWENGLHIRDYRRID